MFNDSGAVSLWLNLGVIIVAGIASWLVIRVILKGADDTKVRNITDVFKYFLGSVCLVAVPAIILNLLNERDQDLVELEYFDKYTTTITRADGTGRYQLARYLSHVAPSGELKDGWMSYYELIKDEPKQYRNAKMEKLGIDTLAVVTRGQMERLRVLDSIIESFESPILEREQFDAVYGTVKPAAGK